jgi:hypothetical protein
MSIAFKDITPVIPSFHCVAPVHCSEQYFVKSSNIRQKPLPRQHR